jgi:hypothetical protein
MKVLLLDPEAAFAEVCAAQNWDLVVDIGRAPLATYRRWSQLVRCPVVSIYDHAEEIDDLHRLRELLQIGAGRMLDAWGIDWWEVLSLEIAPQLQQLILALRLAKELSQSWQLYATRPHPLATALQRLLRVRLTILENSFQSIIHRANHYRDAFSHLDAAQFAQVLEDKFDGNHSIRRRFTRRRHTSGEPVILLPSAYINVSRAALAYAKSMPDHQFLIVHTRSNAKITSPANVQSVSLTPYFVAGDKEEINRLVGSWNALKDRLVDNSEEFNVAKAVGVLEQIPSLFRWGLGLRNAWSQVFESENVTACLSGDDSNPPSSIPLIMAKQRGLPALACHHGALNYHMAIKRNHADAYLVKNEMERDYLQRICNIAPEKIVVAGLPSPKPLSVRRSAPHVAPWLVFFTEPYQSSGWRSHEIYRDLLPRLCALAQACGLRLVLKLHPFDSAKGHRKMLRRFVPEHERQIELLAGPPSDEVWNNTRFALTVQSSTALECAALGIPIFLCAWLRDSYSGYVQQYARFGIGHILESPEQIADIPRLLENEETRSFQDRESRKRVDVARLAELFSPARALAAASNA